MVFALVLGILAPWTAECSWGGFALHDYPIVIVFLGPLYGGAAILIREAVRRTGRGWLSILLLGAAFGVFMAGLVDGSLFNLDYLDDTEYADVSRDPRLTLIPGLGVSAGDLVNYVGNHIVLSIGAPIAIVESLAGPERRRKPWLGRWGLGVVGLLFVLGSLLIHSDAAKGFTPTTPQVLGSVAVVVVLAVLAFVIRPGVRRDPRQAPKAVWCAVVTLVAAAGVDLIPGWGGVALVATMIVAAAVLIVGWSRRTGWGQAHVLAVFSGPLVLGAVAAYAVPNYAPASPAQALIGDLAITVVTGSLLAAAFWRLSLHRVEAAG